MCLHSEVMGHMEGHCVFYHHSRIFDMQSKNKVNFLSNSSDVQTLIWA